MYLKRLRVQVKQVELCERYLGCIYLKRWRVQEKQMELCEYCACQRI